MRGVGVFLHLVMENKALFDDMYVQKGNNREAKIN